jgi:ElaB/YqjD/DUF883 family membrane-anchored ribosome-binding protein
MNNKTKLTVTTLVALAIASASAQAAEPFKPTKGMAVGGVAGFFFGGPVGAFGGGWLGDKLERLTDNDARRDAQIIATHNDVNQLGEYVAESPWAQNGVASTTQATNKQVSDWRAKCIPQGNGGI